MVTLIASVSWIFGKLIKLSHTRKKKINWVLGQVTWWEKGAGYSFAPLGKDEATVRFVGIWAEPPPCSNEKKSTLIQAFQPLERLMCRHTGITTKYRIYCISLFSVSYMVDMLARRHYHNFKCVSQVPLFSWPPYVQICIRWSGAQPHWSQSQAWKEKVSQGCNFSPQNDAADWNCMVL